MFCLSKDLKPEGRGLLVCGCVSVGAGKSMLQLIYGAQKMTLGALELETNSNVGTVNKVPSEQALCVLLQH